MDRYKNMKKTNAVGRFFILTVILLLAACSFCVSAEGGAHTEHTESIAVRTEQELLQMQPGKFYYLAADMTITQTVNIDGEISLCLNGKVLKYENAEAKGSVFHVGKECSLRIFDCSKETHGFISKQNTPWTLTDSSDAEGRRELQGGVIIGGTGEKTEIEEWKNSYFCGGFAYIDGGALFVYGGNIVGNQADYGGAVYVTGDGRFEMSGGKFCGNFADSRGGAIFVQSGTMLLNEGSVSENRSAKNGGGIDIGDLGILEMRGGSVTGNTAGAWSGGIENFGMFTMYDGIVSTNSATEDAGGVYNGGVFTMYGGSIRENTAKYGGGVCNDGKMTLHDGEIRSNLAQESGGGIYNGDRLVINGGQIASNTAATSGGGIENDGTCTMYGGMIGGASATDANMAYLGGGVCVYSGSFAMYGGTIEKNTGVDGGGVENEALFTVQGGTISYNFASTQGGGITNRGQLILGDGASIVSNASGKNEDEVKSGGIYWITENNSAVSVSGAVTVTGNMTNGESANLVICGKGAVSVSALSANTKIGLTLLSGKNLASGAVVRLSDTESGEEKTILSAFAPDHKNFELKYKNEEVLLSEKNIALMIGACVILAGAVAGAIAVWICSAGKKRKGR